jgi:hypothetical protein
MINIINHNSRHKEYQERGQAKQQTISTGEATKPNRTLPVTRTNNPRQHSRKTEQLSTEKNT